MISHIRGGQRTVNGSGFSPFTSWVLGTELSHQALQQVSVTAESSPKLLVC